MRRIITIVAAVFLVGIASWVGYGYYNDKIGPGRELAIEVNDASFDMNYYTEMLKAYSRNIEANQIYAVVGQVAENIINGELMQQGGRDMGVVVTPEEIDEEIKERELPDNEAYRDIMSAGLIQEKLTEYFISQVPDNMEQVNARVMFVESQEVADEVMTSIESGGNFTALVEEYSVNPRIEGDLGWLPVELMPDPLIGEIAFGLEPGEVGKPACNESVNKYVGYWLIEVTDKKDEEIKARGLLLGSEVEAEQVKAELAELPKEDFVLLAQKSQHDSRFQGGELGWLEKGDMRSETFDAVAFNMTLNEVSDPVKDESVQTVGGCWVVQVLDKGEHVVEDNIKSSLADNLFTAWLDEWTENSTIENLIDEQKEMWAIARILQGR